MLGISTHSTKHSCNDCSENYEENNYNREFKVGFKDAKTQGNDDKIETYYENGGTATFSYSWSLHIYGAYNNQGNAQVDLNGNKSRSSSSFVSAFTNINRVAEYRSSSNPTASDKDSWLRIRSDSIRDNDDEAKPVSGIELVGYPGDYNSKYFLVNLYGSITAGTQSREFNVWKVVKGDKQFRADVTVGWPTMMGMGGAPSGSSGTSGTSYANDRVGNVRAPGTNEVRT